MFPGPKPSRWPNLPVSGRGRVVTARSQAAAAAAGAAAAAAPGSG